MYLNQCAFVVNWEAIYDWGTRVTEERKQPACPVLIFRLLYRKWRTQLESNHSKYSKGIVLSARLLEECYPPV